MLDPKREVRIEITLDTPARRIWFVVVCLIPILLYQGLATTQFLAAKLSTHSSLTSLKWAVRLDPWNDQYRNLLGRRYLSVFSPGAAATFLNQAVDLNPNQSGYWLDLAAAYHRLGNKNQENAVLAKTLSVDPKRPVTAWAAAASYMSLSESDQALKQLRVVLEGDPSLRLPALEYCWRLSPDADALLADVIPRDAYVLSDFLDMLISKGETAAAAKTWSRLEELKKTIELRYVFAYINYLIGKHEFVQARQVWRQSAQLAGLSDYQPSVDNLVVNSQFVLPVLNTGFDWTYEQTADAMHSVDPSQSPTGHQSLQIAFDSRRIADAAIRQLIPVDPNSTYQFSAYFKTVDLQGAGALTFVIEDFADGKAYFTSEDLRSEDNWSRSVGQFTTGPSTQLAVLRIQHIPADDAVRGSLWIDDIRLTALPSQAGLRQ